MTRTFFAIVLILLASAASASAQSVGKPTPIPPETSVRSHKSYVTAVSPPKPDETVIEFKNADVGHPVRKVTEKGVTFELAYPLERSQAQPRVMFFPHLMTDRNGILNAMSNEQGIPVKITFPVPVHSVTLVMWGSTDCYALVEAHAKDGKRLDSASVEKVPSRLDPADPVPSFELTVKGENISYVLFGGARNGEYLAAEEIRFIAEHAASRAADETKK